MVENVRFNLLFCSPHSFRNFIHFCTFVLLYFFFHYFFIYKFIKCINIIARRAHRTVFILFKADVYMDFKRILNTIIELISLKLTLTRSCLAPSWNALFFLYWVSHNLGGFYSGQKMFNTLFVELNVHLCTQYMPYTFCVIQTIHLVRSIHKFSLKKLKTNHVCFEWLPHQCNWLLANASIINFYPLWFFIYFQKKEKLMRWINLWFKFKNCFSY